MTTIDLASCLAAIPDRRRAEGKIYSQVGVILFSVIAMLSGARSYRQIHALIRARLFLAQCGFPGRCATTSASLHLRARDLATARPQ